MKKLNFWVLMSAILLTGCGSIRQIECDTVNDEGAHVRITSADRLFSGCGVRVVEYTPKGAGAQYALELDIEDRVIKASKGDLLTIFLTDGKTVTLRNLYDARSEVSQRMEQQTETQMYTEFVPVYDGWYDAIYDVPVTSTYRYSRPVVRTESWVKLYYVIRPEQIQQIQNGTIDHIVIATDRDPIEKTGSDLPEILQGLMALFN